MEIENDQETATTSEQSIEQTSAEGLQSQTDETSQQESGDEETFNQAEIENSFGLEPGDLEGCESMADAMAEIARRTDAALSAGLNYTPPVQQQAPVVQQQQQPFTAQQQTTADKISAKKAAEMAEMEAVKAELASIKGLLREQQEASRKQILAQFDARINGEIDSWKSPTYGVRGNRTFKQNKAAKELRELLNTHCAGAIAMGKSVPEVEYVLRQIRVAHDEHFKTPATKAKQQAPVGTPGAKNSMAAGKEPRSIHEAYQRNAT